MDFQLRGKNSSGPEQATELVWSVNLDFALVTMNPGARRCFELHQSDPVRIGMLPCDVLPPEQVPHWMAFYSRAIKEGSFCVEYEVAKGCILEIFFSPISVGEIVTGVLVRGNDITRPRLAEFAHLEAERKYREIVDCASEGIFQLSAENRFTHVNPAFARVLGYDSVADVLFSVKDPFDSVWVDQSEHDRMIQLLRENGAVCAFECRLKRKNGTVFWASLNTRRIPGVEGRSVAWEGLLEDITERKLKLQNLEERETRQRRIFRENGSIMLLLDSASGQIVDANLAAAKYYGFPVSKLLGMNLSQINVLPLEQVSAERRKAVLEESSTFLVPHRLASGEVRDVEVQSTPVFTDGKTLLFSIIHDVTDRRCTEILLRESEERYRATFEQAAIGIVHTAFDGRILRCNHRYAEILGYSIEELRARSIQEIISPEDAGDSDAMREKMVSGEIDSSWLEKRYLRKDGSTVWVKVTSSRQRDRNGTPMHFMSFVEDISEHKAAKERLTVVTEAMWASEDRYRTAFQTSLDAISIHRESDGLYIDVNRAFFDVMGYSREDVVGHTAEDLNFWVHPADRQRLNRELRMNSVCPNLQAQFRKKDGTIIWGLASIAKMELNGEVCNLAILRDISDAKAAEERLAAATTALKLSEKRYRTAFQTSFDAISIANLENERFIDVNQETARIYGYSREEMVGRTSAELKIWVHLHDRERFLEVLQRDSVCGNLETQFRRADGVVYDVLISATRIELEGQPSALIVVRDVSESKRAEQRLAVSAKALQRSEERYRTAFQTSFDAIAITRIEDGMIVDGNLAYHRIFGFELEETLGKTTTELNIWANPADRLQFVKGVRSDTVLRDREVRFRRKGGSEFFALITATQIELDGVLCIHSVIRDISDAKRAEKRLAASAQALRRSEERYRTAFHTSYDAISVSRLEDGKLIDINETYLRTFGFERQEILGRTTVDVGIWANATDRLRVSQSISDGLACRDAEILFKRKNGEVFPVLFSATEIELDGERCILSVIRDISADKAGEEKMVAAAEALRTSELRYRTVFQTGVDGFSITQVEDATYVDANQAFLDLLGYEREEIIGCSSIQLGIWEDPADRGTLIKNLRSSLSSRTLETRYRKKNGAIFWARMSASIIEIDGKACMLSILRDISDSRAAEEEIRNLAFYDPLTRLPNRRLLIDRIQQLLMACERNGNLGALLFLDLDDFKLVNDTLGHRIGDLLLAEVACRMVGCVRKSDTVARLGGDEFVAMLDDLGSDPEEAAAKARAVAEKILTEIRVPYMLDGHETRTDSSIGVTIFGNKQESTESVLQQADIAMYEAKVKGRGSVHFFAPALQIAVNARATLEKDLRLALKNDEFRLYYQPQISHGRLMGAEALIRWEHPTRGFLGPYDFIPFAEETGQILPIGSWVLETACEQIARWEQQQQNTHLSVAVNISARQFREVGFVSQVLATLQRTGINPTRLKLELTESTFLESTEEVIAKMSTLRSHGICFSIDDFGTGYSSLSYLKRLPLEQLKVDSAFVRDILQDAASAAIAQAVISLGKAMGLTVIAEGVETVEQRDLLAELGCHAYQGYLISKPIPLEEFEALAVRMEEEVTGVRAE